MKSSIQHIITAIVITVLLIVAYKLHKAEVKKLNDCISSLESEKITLETDMKILREQKDKVTVIEKIVEVEVEKIKIVKEIQYERIEVYRDSGLGDEYPLPPEWVRDYNETAEAFNDIITGGQTKTHTF